MHLKRGRRPTDSSPKNDSFEFEGRNLIHHSRMADIKCKLCIAFPLHLLKSEGGVARGERERRREEGLPAVGNQHPLPMAHAAATTYPGLDPAGARRALRREPKTTTTNANAIGVPCREGERCLSAYCTGSFACHMHHTLTLLLGSMGGRGKSYSKHVGQRNHSPVLYHRRGHDFYGAQKTSGSPFS